MKGGRDSELWAEIKTVKDFDILDGDTKLKYLVGLNRWDVCHATYMRSMFQGCRSLTTVDDLAHWDVSKVTDMNAMFQGCSSIAAFDSIYDWDVHSVTNMNSMLRTAPC